MTCLGSRLGTICATLRELFAPSLRGTDSRTPAAPARYPPTIYYNSPENTSAKDCDPSSGLVRRTLRHYFGQSWMPAGRDYVGAFRAAPSACSPDLWKMVILISCSHRSESIPASTAYRASR